MKKPHSGRQAAIRLLQETGKPLRTGRILAAGIHRRDLYALRDEGVIHAVSRGLYELAGRSDQTEHTSLAAVAERIPHGVVCLLSALQFHEVSSQWPHEVWLAVERGTRRPTLDYPPLRIVVFASAAYREGIEEHRIEHSTVQVYCLAKTVLDCFKFRHQIGLDVALEALREAWRSRQVTMDDLWRYAAICRQKNAIRPYLESLT